VYSTNLGSGKRINLAQILGSVRIQSERLYMRVHEMNDISFDYIESINSSNVNRFLPLSKYLWTREMCENYFLKKNNQINSVVIAVFTLANLHIGNIRLFNTVTKANRAEISFVFFREKEWGKGYAYESLFGLIQYLSKYSLLDTLSANYDQNNIRSESLLKKLKFQYLESKKDGASPQERLFIHVEHRLEKCLKHEKFG